ncbi:TetR family transcriptional regulator [Streptomyces sp. NPDC002012]|uniref:TetR/AcrR family transcriptional regulator n=1 Tax=unclassified Streptomyces TaxID=2593676 RepID=UPI002E1385BF|nr:TetR family transcriptional regulator [Streptomyces sp. NBC_01224]
MVRNPERRTALVDAAIEVLADEGARGLTFRAVDARADVPVGTSSNYFANRDDLFMQAAARITVRMTPDPAKVVEAMRPTPSRELVADLMRWLVQRMEDDRTGYLAMLELRLEATRRPALRNRLTRPVRANFDESARFHQEAGLPGDADAFLVLYLAMTGLLLEHFTLPDVLIDPESDLRAEATLNRLVGTVVTRVIPPS